VLAVQPHQDPAVTAKLPPPAADGSQPVAFGLIEYVQAAAACEIVNDWPPTEIDPVRAAPAFASTVNVTVPLPVLELDVWTHGNVVLLDHEHHAEEATEKLPEAAEAASVPLDVGLSE